MLYLCFFWMCDTSGEQVLDSHLFFILSEWCCYSLNYRHLRVSPPSIVIHSLLFWYNNFETFQENKHALSRSNVVILKSRRSHPDTSCNISRLYILFLLCCAPLIWFLWWLSKKHKKATHNLYFRQNIHVYFNPWYVWKIYYSLTQICSTVLWFRCKLSFSLPRKGSYS